MSAQSQMFRNSVPFATQVTTGEPNQHLNCGQLNIPPISFSNYLPHRAIRRALETAPCGCVQQRHFVATVKSSRGYERDCARRKCCDMLFCPLFARPLCALLFPVLLGARRSHSVKISAIRLYTIRSGNTANAGLNLESRERFQLAVDLCAPLGCIHLTGLPGVLHPSISESDDFQLAAQEVGWRQQIVSEFGITYAIEPHVGSICSVVPRRQSLVEAVRASA